MTVMHPLAGDYLRHLERTARVLPHRQRDELVAEIRSHLDAGLPPDASEADVRNLLDELGTPTDIVAAAQPDRAPARRGAREVIALILLVAGVPLVLGWLVGVALACWSPLVVVAREAGRHRAVSRHPGRDRSPRFSDRRGSRTRAGV